MFVVAAIDCISWITYSLMAWEGKQQRNENTTPVLVSGSTFPPPFLTSRLFLQEIFCFSFPPFSITDYVSDAVRWFTALLVVYLGSQRVLCTRIVFSFVVLYGHRKLMLIRDRVDLNII